MAIKVPQAELNVIMAEESVQNRAMHKYSTGSWSNIFREDLLDYFREVK